MKIDNRREATSLPARYANQKPSIRELILQSNFGSVLAMRDVYAHIGVYTYYLYRQWIASREYRGHFGERVSEIRVHDAGVQITFNLVELSPSK